MKNKYGLSIILSVIFVNFMVAQNIELPDLTTVITGESIMAGTDSLPDFKDVMVMPSDSGKVVPVLPDVDNPGDSGLSGINNSQAEKTIFAEGMIGGGYPSLFTGNFSVFRLSDTDPFNISFAHDSAVGYVNNALTDGYSDRTTKLSVEKSFKKNQFDIDVSGNYIALSNGLQSKIPALTSLNQDLYFAAGNIKWNVNDSFAAGVKADMDFYNRYADVAAGEFPTASVLNLNPELYAQWNVNDFQIILSGLYTMESDFSDEIAEGTAHRGEFGAELQWVNNVIKAYGKVGAVVGNNLNDNSVIVPFAVGIESSFPVYFSNRRLGISAEGGLASQMNKISQLETKYKFSALNFMPSETSDWYGKVDFSVPLKESFTGTVNFEYRQTAFDNGYWQPLYNHRTGIYAYGISDMQQFNSELAVTYHYKFFSVTGGWKSFWLDVPVLQSGHQVSLDLNFQSEDSKWGADLKGIWNLDGAETVPVINLEGFAKLSSSVRAVLNVEDVLKLFAAEERVYAGEYICRGGTVTALLKFFF